MRACGRHPHHRMSAVIHEASLFQSLLGARFYALPPAVRALHAATGRGLHLGEVEVERGDSLLARLCAAFAGLPPAMQAAPIAVEIHADPRGETWQRRFGARDTMRSRLRAHAGRLVEWRGPLRFRFALPVFDQALHWRVDGVRVFGVLPLPAGWFDGVRCRESEHDGRYAFEVDAVLPLVGRVVRYRGWLVPAA